MIRRQSSWMEIVTAPLLLPALLMVGLLVFCWHWLADKVRRG